MKNLLSAAVVVVLLLSAPARAAGFLLDTQSARAVGMATAVTSFINEPSAIFYNPAGLVLAEGLQVQAGGTMILPQVTVDPADPSLPSETLVLKPQFPPHAYVSYRVHEIFAAGIGFYVPFGDNIHWRHDWFGREISIHSALANYYFTPSISVKLAPMVRFGIGYDIVRGTVELQRAQSFQPVSPADAQIDLGAGAWGSGANVGLQVDVLKDRLAIGAMFKSSVKLDFDGHVHFSGVPPEFANNLKDQRVSATFTVPAQLQMGISGKPTEKFRLAVDVAYVDWSVFRSITVAFQDPNLNTSEPKNWHSVWNVRLGGEYEINKEWQVRAGAKYDPTPSPDDTLAPDLPDARRVTVNAGASYVQPGWQVDLGYQGTILTSTTSTFPPLPATYTGYANVVTLTGRYRWF